MIFRRSFIAILSCLTLLTLNRAQAAETNSGPAYRTATHFRHGANLGDYLEASPKQHWGVVITSNDLAHIAQEGFDHIRVPIGWHHYTGPGPEFVISNVIFAKVDFVLTNALANHLAVILNIHHFNEFTTNPAAETEKFIAIWRQIAAHYAGLPDTVIFELLNEPKDAATTAIINPIFARAIAEIRKTNPRRTIVVGGGKWNSIDELKNLVLPEDDNLLITVHCYDPFPFTHQGANWAGPDVKTKGIIFPGPPSTPVVPAPNLHAWITNWIQQYNTLPTGKNPSSPIAFEHRLKQVQAWSEAHHRPVYIGEFGAYTTADPVSRANFYRAFRKCAEADQLGWAIWDWNAGFRYWDEKNDRPMPGMREALFGHE